MSVTSRVVLIGMLACAVLTTIGALGPWFRVMVPSSPLLALSAPGLSVSGMDVGSRGVAVLGLGVALAVLVLAVLLTDGRLAWGTLVAAVGFLAIAAIGGEYWYSNRDPDLDVIGWGLKLLVVSSAVGFLLALAGEFIPEGDTD